ncbi:hypothetical protein CDD81_3416 [Ophiocordyceps australis]|uniref:C2H2-type domain-containing protein n=1 Tax=Ophiocordyceps australis TaxID=1399860 RepID=A0A2C5XJM1_9HYPO|nr:hypothetical protein CDD81_3416 [Ophiocordyceps australis]
MSAASSPLAVMTPESDSGSFMAESPPRLDGSQQGLEYRAMVRRLLERFSRPEIERLIDEEGCDYARPSSYMQQPGFSWNECLDGYVAVPGEGGGALEMTRTASRNAHQQAVPSQQASSSAQQKQLRRKPGSASLRPLLPSAVNVFPIKSSGASSGAKSPHGSTGREATQRNDYACGFCAELGITKTCTRRNDLRRHMDQFHNTNAQWLCQHPGCHRAFDWPTAYQIHLRTSHGGSQMMRMADARVALCAQTVFACGFQGCHHVVEAPDSGPGIATAWKSFTGHLIRHCDRGTAVRWDYSHRMRNLLRQSRVADAWADADADTSGLRWDPVSSRVLRKVLETRHVDDVPRLLSAAVALGSDSGAFNSDLQLHLELPVRKTCPAARTGHAAHLRRSKPSSPSSVPALSPPRPSSSSSSSESDAGPSAMLTGIMASTEAATSSLMTAYQDLPESPGFNDLTPLPFRPYPNDYMNATAAMYTAAHYVGHADVVSLASVTPNEQSVFFAGTPAAAVPRAQEAWDASYAPTGLQSPALTDAYLDLSASPMSVPAQQNDMLLDGFAPAAI